MWKGPGQDPGGGPDPGPPPGSSQELSDLKDQFEDQQLMIAQLKEMLRKNEQSSVTQEKVDEYLNTLTRHSAKSKRQKGDTSNQKTMDTPASKKISLLRQQVAQTKEKWVETGKSQKNIEEMITQLKAKMDDSQHSIVQSPLNLSLQDSIKIEYSEHSSSQELYSILLTKEKHITDLMSKVKKLEFNVLDLQENVKEKDSVIDARTKAITLLTDNLSIKRKNTQDTLDETKLQMNKMQENFVSLESDMKARQFKLLEDLRLKNYEIAELEEQNSNLERQKNEFASENAQLKEKLGLISESEQVAMLKSKIEELEELNSRLLEESTQKSPQKGSGKNKKLMEKMAHLQESLTSIQGENDKLSAALIEKEATIKELNNIVDELRNQDTITTGDSDEVAKLKKQLDESNKNMIKVKAQHKSKIKELTKKIEAFKKINDANAEIVKLETENCKLNQKIAELEEEKGTLQLKLVETESTLKSPDVEKEFEEKIRDHIKMLEEKDTIISLLESEIVTLKNKIETQTEKLASLSHLENVQVTSEMTSIQFEEQMDSLENDKRKLIEQNDDVVRERDELLERIEVLNREKAEISTKLDHYIQENIELIDKLEKLSAEKVSSAESIEIVEGLTQQEKLELEAYQKNIDMTSPEGNLKASEENLPQTVDLNESVNELTEETSELLQKIELFTVERREVMEKMEQLKQENNELVLKIKEIENNRDVLVETYELLQSEKEALDARIEVVEKENETLKNNQQQPPTLDLDKMLEENEDLKLKMKDNDRVQDSLNQAREEINLLKHKIDDDKLIIEEKQSNIDNLLLQIKQLSEHLEVKERENATFNNDIINLKRTLSDLEVDNKNLQSKIDQLEEVEANLKQLLESKQEEFETVANSEWENRRLLESKDNEIQKLIKERNNAESVIANLQKAIEEKDENFHRVSSDIKQKYLQLQKQLETNADSMQDIRTPLENKIEELTAKNKEQLEKMKKIAANLKKKNVAYQELENKFKQTEEKWQLELGEKDAKLAESLQQLQELESEVFKLRDLLQEKSEEHQKLAIEFDRFKQAKLEEFQKIEEKNIELQNIIADLRLKAEKNEVNLQQELLQTHDNFEIQPVNLNESSLQGKVQELEMIIETQESELVKYRERVAKLEEGISFVEERRLSLEKKAIELGAQLEEKSATCEEMSVCEDVLERRLAALTAHDEAIERKLENVTVENQELHQHNRELLDANDKLKHKLEQQVERVKDFESVQNLIEELETQNEIIKKQNAHLEADLKNMQVQYDRILEENKNDFDKINSDWQSQFDEVLREKTELMVRCEKFEEDIKDIVAFSNELTEYKQKLEKSEADIRIYEGQIQQLSADNELNQKFREECERLKAIIDEQRQEIDKYQQVEPQNQNSLKSFFDSVPQSTVESKKLEEFDLEKAHLEQEIVALKNEIADLKNRLTLKATAEVTVDSVISQAQDHLTSQEETPQPVPTFIWSQQDNDPFNFIQTQPIEDVIAPVETHQQQTLQQKSENSQEELLNKIKTLEFMLYSVEKEKDDAVLQCHGLTNELTRLVYERENAGKVNKSSVDNLEAQILPEGAIMDTPDTTRQLQAIEFEPVHPAVVATVEEGGVVEEPVHAKSAYLCYDPDKDENCPKIEESATTCSVEAQILPVSDMDTAETRKELHTIEFEPTRPPVISQNEPVKEGQVPVKDAYLCYDLGTAGNFDTFGENDDGWGIGAEEATLEEAHLHKSEVPPSQEMNTLKQTIRVLEMERENYLEEIKQLQIKSGKLIKKLKEFKQKNEELKTANKKLDGNFFNLDVAIEEELKLQIAQLEKRLKEAVVELEKEKVEKSASLQRIEHLVATNERLIDEKAQQDLHIEVVPKKSHVSDFDSWTDKGEYDELLENIKEKSDIIQDLTRENARLANLLENRDTVTDDTPIKTRTEEEYLDAIQRRSAVEEDLEEKLMELSQLQEKLDNLITEKIQLEQNLVKVENDKAQLAESMKNKNDIIERLNGEMVDLEAVKGKLTEEINSLRVEKETESKKQIDELVKQLDDKNNEIASLKEAVNTEISVLKLELNNKIETTQALVDENKTLMDSIVSKDAELLALIEGKNNEIAQLVQEWEAKVDQRGSDVAESWKLHLETRESEFVQVETLLRKEINELEEKCNALVNENNELRRNVDAEIRNEVDRVSALQQQINDRQQYITELTRTLQEKHLQIEQLQQEIVQNAQIQSELDEIRSNLDSEKEIVDTIVKLLEDYCTQQIPHDRDAIINAFNAQFHQFYEKENEIVVLKQHLDDVKLNLAQLQEEFNTKHDEILKVTAISDDCKTELEHLRENYTVLQQTIEEKNQIIDNLTTQLQEIQNLKDYENDNFVNLQQNLQKCQEINAAINVELAEKTSRLDQLALEYHNFQELLQDKEMEINSLKQLLEEKEREYSYAMENLSKENKTIANEKLQEIETLKKRLLDCENHYEEVLSMKDSEIETLKVELNQQLDKNEKFEEISRQLSAKTKECADLDAKINDQTVLVDEENRQLTELREIIEDQVLKIESLKKELYTKSNDYDSLIAQMDMSRISQAKAQGLDEPKSEDEDLSEPVSRAELDLALYMLHQRDVRCEELTVELTQLLEERDTLQLRLSNAIREKEEIARKLVLEDEHEMHSLPTVSTGAIPKEKPIENAEAATETSTLANKLSELRTIGYRKDKTIVDEQEQRRFQQLSIMQQHRDVASKLPPEAAARLVDASYTLSRDVQSPSKVLLNWLWGRSTPKVNNI